MAFDVRIQPLGINIASPDPDEVEPGQDVEIELIVTIGLLLPFQQPSGQPLVVPLGNVRIPFSPDIAIQAGEKLAEEGQKFPQRPSIDIANTLAGVDRVQEFTNSLRNE